MQINVSQLLREPIGSTRDCSVNEAADISGDGKEYQVQGNVQLMRTQRSILVKGSLHTEVDLICSRCLSHFRHPLTLRLEEEFLPTVDVASGAPLPSPDDAGTFTIDDHHILDLTEAIRQYVLLFVPMKPLCHKECAGLCHNCGKNLNLGQCDCPVQDIDPRWSELTKLL